VTHPFQRLISQHDDVANHIFLNSYRSHFSKYRHSARDLIYNQAAEIDLKKDAACWRNFELKLNIKTQKTSQKMIAFGFDQ
jgi:hypothetical protein